MIYQLTDEAARDIEGILDHSLKNFGETQAKRYFEALKECIELLADNPNIGHSAEDILPDYLRFPHESHVIFYKMLPPSVLHERMDPKKHIKK